MSSSDNLMDYGSLDQLQRLLSQLKSNWPVLPSGMWNSSCVHTTLRLLHDLGRKGEASNLINVLELSRSIEKIISDVYEENMQADEEEIEKLNQYLQQLTDAIEASDSKQVAQESFTNSYEVLYLPRNKVSGDLICSAIEKNGWLVNQLSDIEALKAAILQYQSEVVLLDTEYLPQIEVLNKAFAKIDPSKAEKPELIFISNHCDVEIRLEVLRAGATQCFSEPISINDLILSIKEAISPELKPHYRVLVVEDDVSQSKFACKLLKKGGFDTLAITDPLNVMDAVQGFQPDLILMDLYMPGANGIELTQLIRDRRDASFMPIVFLSGEDDVEKKILALYSGADDFLTKPVRPQHLIATVLTRIKRAKEMISGSNTSMVDSVSGLVNRRRLLDELDMICIRLSVEREQCGLFVITVEGKDATTEDSFTPTDNALVARIADVLGPVLGKRDLLSRTGRRGLGVLVERASMHDIERLGMDLYQQVRNELLQGNQIDHSWGIGLVTIDAPDLAAYKYLKQAEIIAKTAADEEAEHYLQHNEAVRLKTATHQEIPDELLKERVRTALKSGFVEFHEQRYLALHEDGAVVEHIPSFVSATGLTSEIGDIYQSAGRFNGMGLLNRLVCKHAVRMLGEVAFRGIPNKVLVWMSGLSIHDDQLIPFLQSELRKLHVVGTGLIIEFDLPSLAPELKRAKKLLDELSTLGITILLGNFACNDTAYKVLSYLQADAVRLHPSLLRVDDEQIDKIVSDVRALNAFIILPKIDTSQKLNLHWSEVADYIQAEHLAPVVAKPLLQGLDSVETH
ncbi:MAG: response regulator [Candidatus Thiodiazotropha sp. 6PLUC2]